MRLTVFFLCFCLVSVIQALDLKVEKAGKSELRDSQYLFTITDGPQVYEYWHAISSDKFTQPVQCGNLFAYSVNYSNLVVVDGARKQITARMVLPDEIQDISWKDESTLLVKVFSDARKVDHTYEISLAAPCRLPASSSLLGYRFEWNDVAQRLALLGLSLDQKAPKIACTPEEIKAHLDRWAEFDVVNPWVGFYEGLYHYRYRDREEARRLWGLLISDPRAQWYHLLRISTEVYLLEEKDLARSLFKEGMKRYLATGAEPRMCFTLIELMVHVGGYAPKIEELRKAGEWEEASSLLERFYEFSPRCEAFSPAMAAFAAELERAGKAELAKTWRDRAQEARGFEFFGGMSQGHSAVMSLTFNGIFAAAVAIILFTLLMLLKSPYSHVWMGKDRFKYRILSRQALLSILLVMAGGLFCIGIAGSKVRAIAQASCMPLGSSSSLDHPGLLPWVEKAQESPEKHFMLGLAFQGRGNGVEGEERAAEYKRARAEYAQATGFAQTYNNLALLDKAEGKDPGANFKRALEMDPKMPEAVWNTERKTSGGWSEVHRDYCPDRDMLAVPTSEIYQGFLTGATFAWGNFSFYGADAVSGFYPIYLIAIGVIAVFVLFSLLRPMPPEEHPKKAIWWSAVLVPGTSRFWSIFGCLVTAIWILALVTIYSATRTTDNGQPLPFLSLLEAIAVPSFQRAFGIEGTFFDFDLRWRIIGWARAMAIALPCLNLVMLAIERRRPATSPEKPANP